MPRTLGVMAAIAAVIVAALAIPATAAAPGHTELGKFSGDTIHRFVDRELGVACYWMEDRAAMSCVKVQP